MGTGTNIYQRMKREVGAIVLLEETHMENMPRLMYHRPCKQLREDAGEEL